MSEEALAAACAEKVRQLEFSVKQSAFYSVRKELETELAIARVALAALRERAEPVYQCMDDGRWYDTEKRLYDEVKENGNECRVLYTAPPAPSHENVHYADAAEAEIAALRKRIAELEASPPAPVVTAETFEEWSRRCEIQLTLCRPEFREVAEITWNACRAAMLAAPPAPVTAGWIACSERMPDDGVSVLAYCKCGDNFSGIYTMRAPVIRSKNSRKDDSVVHHERVTHWMPLPAAPGKEG
ncbi:DUF551 domain-containing protein [Cronobacter sakazakii]